MEYKKGDRVCTPRFLWVKLEDVFESEDEAKSCGYIETTHYCMKNNDGWNILGKHIDINRMAFAACRRDAV